MSARPTDMADLAEGGAGAGVGGGGGTDAVDEGLGGAGRGAGPGAAEEPDRGAPSEKTVGPEG
jgi:hypothetical protein